MPVARGGRRRTRAVADWMISSVGMGGSDPGQPAIGIEGEAGLLGQQVGAADRHVRGLAVADQPGGLGERPEVGPGVERPGPGQRQAGEDDEHAHDDRQPREDPVGGGRVEASLPSERDRIEAATERAVPRRVRGEGQAESASSTSGSISSRRCAPWFAGVVHLGAHRVHGDELRRGGDQQLPEHVEVLFLLVEPAVPCARREHHGHPIVDLGHLLVGGRGDDRARPQLVTFTILAPPDLPEPREGERLAVGPLDEPRLLALLALDLGPLVEGVGRDDAALLAVGVAVSVALGHRLRPGVDHAVPDLHVLGPDRHQAPVDGVDLAHSPVLHDHVDVVGRGHVVAGIEGLLGDLLRPEVLGDLVRRSR